MSQDEWESVELMVMTSTKETTFLVLNDFTRCQSKTRPFATIINHGGNWQHLTFAGLENSSNRAAGFLHRN
ncbi:hypothetical protein F4819DRAFT_447889 [Hypoxylon fuscum]|nr:hypothetical protein F4819DRAFT_447889 [Hypoxylon fuscum]